LEFSNIIDFLDYLRTCEILKRDSAPISEVIQIQIDFMQYLFVIVLRFADKDEIYGM